MADSAQPPPDHVRYAQAVLYSIRKHGNQVRKDGSPYFAHPLRVAESLRSIGGIDDMAVIIAGLCPALIEDTAQGLGATYRGRHLGTWGEAGFLSFHSTTNVVCGEGGALPVRSEELMRRLELIPEQGPNRSPFLPGSARRLKRWPAPRKARPRKNSPKVRGQANRSKLRFSIERVPSTPLSVLIPAPMMKLTVCASSISINASRTPVMSSSGVMVAALKSEVSSRRRSEQRRGPVSTLTGKSFMEITPYS